jgi:hypothetical protein
MKSFQFRFLTPVRISIIILTSVLLVTSCADEVDTVRPRVQISSPGQGATFLSVDTIIVDAQITDDMKLEFAEIGITNDEFNFISETQTVSLTGTNFRLLAEFELNQPLLESGQYYLGVRASDGSNFGSAYQEIAIVGAPIEIEKYIAVSRSGMNTQVLSSEDLNNWQEVLSYQTDASGGALNYRQNLLGISGGEIGNTNFYSTVNWDLVETVPGFGSPSLPFFLGISFEQQSEEFLLLQNDPRLRVFDKSAAPVSSFSLIQGFLPVKAFERDDIYFVDEGSVVNSNHVLSAYSIGGVLFASYALQGPVINIHKKDFDEYFVWIDSPDGLELRILNTSTDLLSPVFQRLGEGLESVIQIGTQVFILSTSQGLLQYNFQNGGTAILDSSFPPSELVYDDLDGFIYATEGPALRRLSLQGNILGELSFGNEVVFFGIDYNR